MAGGRSRGRHLGRILTPFPHPTLPFSFDEAHGRDTVAQNCVIRRLKIDSTESLIFLDQSPDFSSRWCSERSLNVLAAVGSHA